MRKNAQIFNHIWGGRLQLLHSEFPEIWGKFYFLFFISVEHGCPPEGSAPLLPLFLLPPRLRYDILPQNMEEDQCKVVFADCYWSQLGHWAGKGQHPPPPPPHTHTSPSVSFHCKWRAGMNPIQMSHSDLCITRNETVWSRYLKTEL